MTKINITFKDFENEFTKLIEYIKENADGGHSFEVSVDPGTETEKSFYIDGDGDFEISDIKVEKEEERTPCNEDFAIKEAEELNSLVLNDESINKDIRVRICNTVDDVIDLANKVKTIKENIDSAYEFASSSVNEIAFARNKIEE